MNKSLLMLEYDKILMLLASETSNEDSKKKIFNIRPCFNNLEKCKELLKETDDAYILSCKFGGPDFTGIKDITKIVKRANFSAVLSAAELMLVLSVLKVIENIKNYRKQFLEINMSLDNYFDKITSNSYLKNKIETAILSEDEISDTASKELYDIRRKIKLISLRSREKLESIIKSSKYQKCLQEPIVTIRESRFVLPVKSEYRSEIQGIVHDISASGSTVFIEPMFAIEDNNILGSLKLKEKYEIERILKELSKEVSNFSEGIICSYNALIDLDVIFAKANLGYKLKCCVPSFNTQGKINLKKARHPLISKNEAVPIDISLGDKFDTLIVTGSNTGGKTVVLKTVGLLCAMAMSGLMIPAECTSEVSVFDNILDDIGDEQSIEQSLSTFSSHIKNIIYILKNITNKSLVLLDEIGAGTDPIEGASLARSIIENIQERGTKSIVTTHYKELKEYAIVKSRVENACCEFDITSLRPTYRLIIGVPGNSYAFLIAEKLGMNIDIISRAKKLIGSEGISIDKIIKQLEETRLTLEEKIKFTQNEYREYNKLKQEFEEKITDFERKKNYETEKYKYESKILLDKVRSQTDELMEDIRLIRKSDLNISSEKRRDIYCKLKKIEDQVDPVDEVISDETDCKFKIGDSVLVLGINKEGKIISFESENSLLVQIGNIKLNLSKDKLKPIKISNENKKSIGKVLSKVRGVKNINVSSQIDLRGKNVLEALSELEMFIDSSILAKIGKITIIHGKGTGVLRKEISKYLKSNRHVANFRLGTFGEGESGVSIVELKI